MYRLVDRHSYIRAFLWRELDRWNAVYVLGSGMELRESWDDNKRNLMRAVAKAVREAGY